MKFTPSEFFGSRQNNRIMEYINCDNASNNKEEKQHRCTLTSVLNVSVTRARERRVLNLTLLKKKKKKEIVKSKRKFGNGYATVDRATKTKTKRGNKIDGQLSINYHIRESKS